MIRRNIEAATNAEGPRAAERLLEADASGGNGCAATGRDTYGSTAAGGAARQQEEDGACCGRCASRGKCCRVATAAAAFLATAVALNVVGGYFLHKVNEQPA